jgi:hypothetical protein
MTKKIGMAMASSLLLASCGTSFVPGERAAEDRIMLVRDTPPTLGHHRLVALSGNHPDLKRFLARRGRIDFVAETSSENRLYLVLYDLEARQAHVCRMWKDQAGTSEFAGPYPITEKEARILTAMRKEACGGIDPDIAESMRPQAGS